MFWKSVTNKLQNKTEIIFRTKVSLVLGAHWNIGQTTLTSAMECWLV